MQNRYTGDIGDFSKLGLLRFLQDTSLSIGVNWYLAPDESHNSDGRFVQYLQDHSYRELDEPLWLKLKSIIGSGQRTVSALEKEQILKAAFYSEMLDFTEKAKPERAEIRGVWHRKAVKSLSGCDIVFVDPDNGIIVPSAKGTKKENKYVTPEELRDYYLQGASVIYYQHKGRRPDAFYLDQHNRITDMVSDGHASGLGLRFTRTSLRYYYFIIQPVHQNIISEAVQNITASEWSRCFESCR